ncbi:MAG: NAD(P)/FAD-dependent oxidoreductase [Candidatus Hydrogenedentes bacterium]|jgi:protoporphyrinogen oxidase|nr:NAD(P)/FAD-dependent oxidoreductase [Candidatus Hydrogenedentota bacterium]
MPKKIAIIIGAGPAGLTAAYELLKRTDVHPIVFEASEHLGGIARTVNYKGNRIDIGGHRFFSKSDRVMDWWQEILPLQKREGGSQTITYRHQSRDMGAQNEGSDPDKVDEVMLVRERTSRIYFLRKFFPYPISLGPATLLNLGPVRTVRIGLSYLKALAFPVRDEKNLEEFIVNRFGRELYSTFFKDYTEKVWGIPCKEISAEWGAQRIKGLSVVKAAQHFFKSLLPRRRDIAQKNTETSLIETFLYPKHGPGQMWEEVARRIREGGGEVILRREVVGIELDGERVASVTTATADGSQTETHEVSYVISTMPVQDLIRAMDGAPPAEVRRVAGGLVYRDFITVGLLVRDLEVRRDGGESGLIQDNWIYIQEPDVKLGRLQTFNNWSPYLVNDPDTVWLGLEYFCNEGDSLWAMDDDAFAQFAINELSHIGIVRADHVLDSTVIRMPKTYPAYFGAYGEFDVIRSYLDPIQNLFLVGRNGMHKYNNQDHSMLTAMAAVDAIASGSAGKESIWAVNTETDYHEEK